MFNTIKNGYLTGRYNDTHLYLFVRVGYLTTDQKTELVALKATE